MLVKCQKCPDKGEKEEMLKVGAKYYHHDCHAKWEYQKSLVLCQYCRNRDPQSLMTKEGKAYYHHECLILLREESKKKEQDFNDWCTLFELIKEIHKKEVLHKFFVSNLQDLHNGTIRKGKMVYHRQDDGVHYCDLIEGYELCRDTIVQSINKKTFDNEYAEMQYGFAIVQNKLNEVANERRKAEALASQKDELLNRTERFYPVFKAPAITDDSEEEEIDLTKLLD